MLRAPKATFRPPILAVLTTLACLAFGTALQAQTTGYQIYFWEDFDGYSLGNFYPNGSNNSRWEQLHTTFATPNPQIAAVSSGSADKLLRIWLDETTNSASGLISRDGLAQPAEPSAFFTQAGSGTGPSGYLERHRWAVISDLRLRDNGANATPGEHILTALRVQPSTSDQSRFGVAIQPMKGANGNCSDSRALAFLQFTNPASSSESILRCFRLSDPYNSSHNDSQGDYVFRFDGSERYVLTFEEWEQFEGFGWHRHWRGTVYRVDPGETLVKLGSKDNSTYSIGSSQVCGNSPQGNYVCLSTPSLSHSRILTGDVFTKLDLDLSLLYAAYYQY